MEFNVTVIIILVTAAVSILSFGNGALFAKLQFNPYQAWHRREAYRLLTHGFLHADWIHLFVNMLVLYSFGSNVEYYFMQLRNAGSLDHPVAAYLLLYLGGIVIASLSTLFRYRDNYYYNSVGASGAVSAVVFTSIFFAPLDRLYLFAAIPIPGIVFAVLYLIYSSYMSRRGGDNINHDAHFAGAVFGFVFPLLIDPGLISHFIHAFTR